MDILQSENRLENVPLELSNNVYTTHLLTCGKYDFETLAVSLSLMLKVFMALLVYETILINHKLQHFHTFLHSLEIVLMALHCPLIKCF